MGRRALPGTNGRGRAQGAAVLEGERESWGVIQVRRAPNASSGADGVTGR